MSNPKLVISSRKYKGETGIVSVRIPSDMIKKIDNISETTGRTRNEIMSLCLEFAIDNLELKSVEQ